MADPRKLDPRNDLTARLDDWCLAFVGLPVDGYVLIGRVSGHDRLTDGNIAATSLVRFLAEDFSFAFTSSEGRRYHLGSQVPLSLKTMCVFASIQAISWGLPGDTTVRFDVNPHEIAGRHLGTFDD